MRFHLSFSACGGVGNTGQDENCLALKSGLNFKAAHLVTNAQRTSHYQQNRLILFYKTILLGHSTLSLKLNMYGGKVMGRKVKFMDQS